MIYRVRSCVSQWGVGQGGFNTQWLSINGPSNSQYVNVVYDCGGKRPLLESSIESFLHGIIARGENRVEAIFISHMDLDHYGGVKYLLTRLEDLEISVGAVYIPHLTKLERLALVVEASRWSPENVFSEVTSGADIEPLRLWDSAANLTDEFPDIAVIELGDSQSAENDDAAEDLTEPSLGELGEGELSTELEVGSGRVRVRAALGTGLEVARRTIWEWLPMIDTRTRYSSSRIKSKIENDPDINIDEVEKLTLDQIQEILTDPSRSEALAAALKSGGGVRVGAGVDSSFSNLSSIVLFAGPDISEDLVWEEVWEGFAVEAPTGGWYDYPKGACRFRGGHKSDYPSGWLGTGDAELKTKSSLNELQKFLGPRISSLAVVGVPHHGGQKNSDSKLPEHLPDARFATLHYGKNRYGHPSSDVVGSWIGQGRIPIHINETGALFSQKMDAYFSGPVSN